VPIGLLAVPAASYLMFIFIFCRSGVVLWRGRRRSFAVEFNAGEHDATLLHLCHHAPRHHDSPRSNRCARGRCDCRSTQCTDIGIAAVSSPSSGSASGTTSGSTTTNGSAVGGTGAISTPASTNPQSPLILPGEIPDTSTQAARTTATASGPSSPVCPPPVPSSDGGSANLSEIAGVPINGC
jgi:hypothetical protein